MLKKQESAGSTIALSLGYSSGLMFYLYDLVAKGREEHRMRVDISLSSEIFQEGTTALMCMVQTVQRGGNENEAFIHNIEENSEHWVKGNTQILHRLATEADQQYRSMLVQAL
ncbi:hypothetical protein AVEN_75373-1 [Araneus ventricosus]|uniref:Uncharacterized protein n=1 Tax=Araneus ventricosus TaxID=182803 RepID=A0A4Y2V547_ARAVE|nr:hypothetical protein AVEN_75373-1 [Araneus ventricosus]